MTVPKHPPYLGGPIGWLRQWYWLHVRRWKGELCQDCGGRYFDTIWDAADDLWEEVVGQKWERNLAGQWIYRDGDQIVTEDRAQVVSLLCPNCFSKRADAKGIMLVWRPTVRQVRKAGTPRRSRAAVQ